jgi:hypothetical protein
MLYAYGRGSGCTATPHLRVGRDGHDARYNSGYLKKLKLVISKVGLLIIGSDN